MTGPADVEVAVADEMIPYAHVADLDRSIAFYTLLGFSLADTHALDGTVVWAHLRCRRSRLFLVLADAPIDASAQAVLFYLWTNDVAALRARAIANGIPASALAHPPYMPAGEFRLVDPDGYAVLVGQPAADGAG